MRPSIERLLGAALLAATLTLASCSGIPLAQRQTARLHRYEAYAGAPVREFTWNTGYKSWSPLAPDKLLVWTDLDQPYLVTVYHPCTDLMFARHIGITSTVNTVQARFDFVTADGWRCMISTIQPIDYRRLQRDAHRPAAAAGKTQR